jgi:hypothetical protein
VKTLITVLVFLVPATGLGAAKASQPNWSGSYSPCSHHADLLNRQHLDLAVRISTSNTVLAEQFAKAMEFWKEVLDLEWHEVDSQDCAIQVVDGTPALFDFCTCLSAKSQLPDRAPFQGWIAFNPRLNLTPNEMFLDSVHEIGHLLGLPHNPSNSSVMFYFGVDKPSSLNVADLETLATQHQLRADIALRKGGLKEIRVVVPGQNGERGPGWLQGTVRRIRPFQPWSHAGVADAAGSPNRSRSTPE